MARRPHCSRSATHRRSWLTRRRAFGGSAKPRARMRATPQGMATTARSAAGSPWGCKARSPQLGATGSTQVSQVAAIGGPGAYGFSGQIDEVAVYNGALGSTRVQAHYLSARPQAVSAAGRQADYASSVLFDQPKGYWRFGEMSGGTAGDSSGTGQHASYSGGYSLGQAGAFPGDTNGAVNLNGSNGYVITGNLLS